MDDKVNAQSAADSSLFTRKENENFTYIIIYIDDILIVSKNEVIKEIVRSLTE